MNKDKDFRLKLTSEAHRVLGELARGAGSTLQAYVERLIVDHLSSKLDEARRLVAVAAEGSIEKTSRAQLLYFAQRGGPTGPIKIGVATAVARRLKSLQTGCDEPLVLLHECEQAGEVTELALHRKFRGHRMEGEWFKASADVLQYIEELKVRGSGRA